MRQLPWLDDTVVANGAAVRENFRDWFKKSKVLEDDTGQPLQVYHGTTPWQRDGVQLGDVEIFDRLASVNIVLRRPSIDTVGIWFSSVPGETGAQLYSGLSGAIYPVYLSIQNPYVTTFAMMIRRANLLAGFSPRTMIGKEQVDALRTWLKETGRDGIKIVASEGTALSPSNRESTEFEHQTAWIALEPEQIKSAISNCGLYLNQPSLTDREALRNLILAMQARDVASGKKALIAGRVRLSTL